MEYKIVRTDRKTLAIFVLKDGRVEVRAPIWYPKREIERFVAQKENWIYIKQQAVLAYAQQRRAYTPRYGGTARLLGHPFPILAADGPARFDGKHFCIPAGLSEEAIAAACEQIYRVLAKELLPRKTAQLAAQMGLSAASYKNIHITGAKTRWGSCSARGEVRSLNFAWRLMLAGEDEIDYVVVHELAHLREMNHSPRFWALVAETLPDYKQRRLRLKQLQATVMI